MRALLGLFCLVAMSPGGAAEPSPPPPAPPTDLKYDVEYPFIGYSEHASNNAISRLQGRLDRGELKLESRGPRGYLDSLLRALGIDSSSQTLVFSKSSMQIEAISAATPRALYFNDDTYVGWVQGGLIEVATMDTELGPVFYTLQNQTTGPARFDREMQRCLVCHDTFSLSGGGVPRFLFQSAFTRTNGDVMTDVGATETSDQTPLEDRWGGWYVTGGQGELVHLGNIMKDPAKNPVKLAQVSRGNLSTLEGLFPTSPYITNKSDIVALLVLDHQVYVHDLITRANYKTRWLMAKTGAPSAAADGPWAGLPPRTQAAFKPMLEQLVQAMLFVNAAPLSGNIASGSGFDAWFQAQGPRDRQGRSLREFDLKTRLFKYPLSFLIYSAGFDHLPAAAKDFVYGRLNEILSGRDQSAPYAQIPAERRKDLLEILDETKPDFAHASNPMPTGAHDTGSLTHLQFSFESDSAPLVISITARSSTCAMRLCSSGEA
jgi:hypothetical protein